MHLVSPCSPRVPGCLVSTWGFSTIASQACCDLRPWFFTTRFLARGLSWLSSGPLVLSQHLGTVDDCSPGQLRSWPLVFLQLPSSLAVFLGSSGVPGCLTGTWGLSTIAPRASCDLCGCVFYFFSSRSWSLLALLVSLVLSKHLGTLYNCPPSLLRYLPLVFFLPASSFAVSPGSPGVSGCLVSTWVLSTIAPWAFRDLRRWFFYDSLPRSRSLLSSLGSLAAFLAPGHYLLLFPGLAAIFAACFFSSPSLVRGLCLLSLCPRVLSKHLGIIDNHSRVLPRSSSLVFFLLSFSFSVSGGFVGVSWCLTSTWGLSTIAPRALRDLRCWFFYHSLPRMRSLLAFLGPPVLC